MHLNVSRITTLTYADINVESNGDLTQSSARLLQIPRFVIRECHHWLILDNTTDFFEGLL